MLRRRLKMALLAFRKPELVAPALTISRAVVFNGEVGGTFVVKRADGITQYFSYTVIGKSERDTRKWPN